MANPYYEVLETIIPQSRGRSRIYNEEFEAVEDGFDALSDVLDRGVFAFAGASTGSSNAYAVTMPQTRTVNQEGDEVVFVANHTNTGAATLNVDSIGAVALVDAAGDALGANDIESGLTYEARYDDSGTRFQLVSPTTLPTAHTHVLADITDAGALAALDTVDTAQIEDDAVTTAKIDDGAVTAAKIDDGAVTTAKMGLDAGLDVAGGDITVEAGDGLDFSANTGTAAAGAATTSELLDHYEEGSWTPNLWDNSNSSAEGQGYSVQTGAFVRIGRLTYITGRIVMASLGTLNAAQNVRIGPIPVSVGIGVGPSTLPCNGVNLNLKAIGEAAVGQVENGLTYISVRTWDELLGTTAMTIAEVGATGELVISGCYMA